MEILDYDFGTGVGLELFEPTLFVYTGLLKSKPHMTLLPIHVCYEIIN